jgi:alanine dehydrogenase
VRDALLVVDSRDGALAEAGDILTPLREGVIDERHVHAELGELLAGTKAGRSSMAQITLYKSLGLAVQDLAAAALFVRAAEAAGIGGRIAL